jgi:uncharacterized membrane protein
MASKSQSSRPSRSSRGGRAAAARSSPTARTTTVPRSGGGAGRNGAGRTAVVPKPAEGSGARSRSAAARNAPVADVPASGKLAATWLQWVTLALALVGLAVSSYLTYTHFSEAKILGCSESGLVNCQKVTTSSESYVFGIPVAVLGLAFYAFLVPVMTPYAWRLNPFSGLGARAGWTRWVAENLGIIRAASLFVGVGFVLYLLYAELYMIGSICLYCTSVHVITFLLFVLTACAAAAWGLRPRQEADAED